jgi:glycerol-3-phosphate dehydrogenase (NAD(P)+)|tara:strand:+ start:17 stop:1024 length:1008 start_codon:yes stop_codon:yes gene_type:complete
MNKITVIGNTTWGFSLSCLISKKVENISILTRSREEKDLLNQSRIHPNLSEKMKLPIKVNIESDTQRTIQESDTLIIAVPSNTLPENLSKIREFVTPEKYIISATKGISVNGKRMSEVINNHLNNLPTNNIGVLSGPNLASEISEGKPTVSIIAFNDINTSNNFRNAFSSDKFRIYSSIDVIGTELGGAFKNIIAIGAGIIDGLELGTNAKSAFVTRGLHEITKLGVKLGADKTTFSGLSGMGDLMTSCFGNSSRNWKLGVALSQGLSAEEFSDQSKITLEGIQTTLEAEKLSKKYQVSMPITETTAKILKREISINSAIKKLMTRELSEEEINN